MMPRGSVLTFMVSFQYSENRWRCEEKRLSTRGFYYGEPHVGCACTTRQLPCLEPGLDGDIHHDYCEQATLREGFR